MLAGLKSHRINLNDFISRAILETAATDASNRVAIKSQAVSGQVDLVDMLQDIHKENVVASAQSQPLPGYVPTLMDEIRERQFLREQQERDYLKEWLRMPAGETWQQVERLMKQHGKRPRNSALFVQIRAKMPFEDFKASWRCWIEVVDETGKGQGRPAVSMWRKSITLQSGRW